MGQIRVLLVDDEHEFLDLMRKRLSKRNIEVVSADSGEKALSLFEAGDFDVVVLDVKMPGMGGLETLRKMKEMDTTIEVIILSGHADMTYVDRGLELGAFDYLIKPVALNDLLTKLNDACSRRAARF